MTPAPASRTARRLLRDWRAWIVFAFALYTLAGFVIVPLVAKRQIPAQIRRQLQCESTVRSGERCAMAGRAGRANQAAVATRSRMW